VLLLCPGRVHGLYGVCSHTGTGTGGTTDPGAEIAMLATLCSWREVRLEDCETEAMPRAQIDQERRCDWPAIRTWGDSQSEPVWRSPAIEGRGCHKERSADLAW